MKEKAVAYRAFDEQDRPSLDIIDDCVHCGFCLPSCPTYLETGNELESPRGRIYLIKSAVEGRVPMGKSLISHLDSCLGCLACEPACPSGVKYGNLIEAARSQIERRHRRPPSDKFHRSLLFSIFPYPSRLKILLPFLYIYQITGFRNLVRSSGILSSISQNLERMEGILPEVSLSSLFSSPPAITPARGERRFRVALLTGCVQRVLFSQVNEATVRVLSRNGCEVVIPENQSCCGALSVHSGRLEEGRNFAKKTIEAFKNLDVDAVIVNSAGCGSVMKEYGELLVDEGIYSEEAHRFSEKTKDVMEFLADIGLEGEIRELDMKVTYQDACHIAHAQRIKEQPRDLIKRIPGIEFVELPEAEVCCGSAGIYNIVQPDMADRLLERKLSSLKETGADMLVAGNPGCLLQIQKGIRQHGLDIKTAHPIELLDWAYK